MTSDETQDGCDGRGGVRQVLKEQGSFGLGERCFVASLCNSGGEIRKCGMDKTFPPCFLGKDGGHIQSFIKFLISSSSSAAFLGVLQSKQIVLCLFFSYWDNIVCIWKGVASVKA